MKNRMIKLIMVDTGASDKIDTSIRFTNTKLWFYGLGVKRLAKAGRYYCTVSVNDEQLLIFNVRQPWLFRWFRKPRPDRFVMPFPVHLVASVLRIEWFGITRVGIKSYVILAGDKEDV